MLFRRKRNPIRFVILFQGRSGSTMLKGHLMAHQAVHAFGEIFDAFPRTWPNQHGWLKKFYCDLQWTDRSHKVIGFTTKLSSIADPSKFKEFVEANNVRVIHLDRSNPVKLAVSVIRAKRLRELSGESNIKSDGERLGPIRISVDEFRRGLNRKKLYAELSDYVETLGVPKVHVYYEEFLEDEKQALEKIWDFLEVDNADTKTETLKNTPDDLTHAVSNLEELKAAFPELAQYF